MRLSNIVKFSLMVFCLVSGKIHKTKRQRSKPQNCDNQLGNPCVKICQNSTKFYNDDSLYLLPIINDERKNIANTRGETEKTWSMESTACPKSLEEGSPVCPHIFVINYDPHRVPAIVFEARCACRECLEANVKRCTKVFNYRTVLYKRKGSDCFDRHLKAFAIACRCIGYDLQKISTVTPPD